MLGSYRSRLTEQGSLLAASMMRDIEAGAQAEGDHILSALLARARARGVSAPLLEVAATHLETYMRRRAREAAAKAS